MLGDGRGRPLKVSFRREMQIMILGIALPSKKGYQRNRYLDVYQMGAERDGRCGEVSPYVVVFQIPALPADQGRHSGGASGMSL